MTEPKKSKWAQTRNGVQTILWLPAEIKAAMQDLAQRNDRPMTREVDRAFRYWLEKHNALPPGVGPIENPPR